MEDNEFLRTRQRGVYKYFRYSFNHFLNNNKAVLGLSFLLIIVIISVVGPLLSQHSYSAQNLHNQGLLPNKVFWLGTDTLGRDLYVRITQGIKISLAIGVSASLINLLVGGLVGFCAGYYGGIIDYILSGIINIIYSIPLILYVIIFSLLSGSGFLTVLLTIGLVYWVDIARVIRSMVLDLKETEYIQWARAAGLGTPRLMLNHFLPNLLGAVIILFFNGIPRAIFTETFLSFLGLGIAAPKASLGVLVVEALNTIYSYPHILFFPVLAILLLMLGFNFICDSLRDAFDPQLRDG